MSILAIVVLYRCPHSESRTVACLRRALGERTDLAMTVLVFDNGGQGDGVDPIKLGPRWRFFRSERNVGVAGAYQYGLAMAAEQGCTHLLLLDQDTGLDGAFLGETSERIAVNGDDAPAVILPLVLDGEKPISPLIGWLSKRPAPVGISRCVPIRAINSGMTVRRDFLEALGGFDQRFWLDGLDHWLMLQARRKRVRVEVIPARLHHDLSISKGLARISGDRFKNILAAERLLYAEFWSLGERILYIVQLLWRATKLALHDRTRTLTVVKQIMWAVLPARFLD